MTDNNNVINFINDMNVPLENSLQDDAPGFNSFSSERYPVVRKLMNSQGPTCWKCKGNGEVLQRNKSIICKVCQGNKRINANSKFVDGSIRPGHVTKQFIPNGWKAIGPTCKGFDNDYLSLISENDRKYLSPDIGEELCVLIGEWRIFQRYSKLFLIIFNDVSIFPIKVVIDGQLMI